MYLINDSVHLSKSDHHSSDSVLTIHASPPNEMIPLIKDDAWGTFFPRG